MQLLHNLKRAVRYFKSLCTEGELQDLTCNAYKEGDEVILQFNHTIDWMRLSKTEWMNMILVVNEEFRKLEE